MAALNFSDWDAWMGRLVAYSFTDPEAAATMPLNLL
jgi:hypothetical protein